MPEGHLYHRLARNLYEFTGCELAACSPQGRFTEGAAQINGARFEVAEAYGKHLLVRFAGGRTVHVHLGMRGKLLRFPDVSRPPLPQVRLRLAGADAAWDLIAPATCELLDDTGVTGCWPASGPTRCARTPTPTALGPACRRHPAHWERRSLTSR
jgi:endonuclease VIII